MNPNDVLKNHAQRIDHVPSNMQPTDSVLGLDFQWRPIRQYWETAEQRQDDMGGKSLLAVLMEWTTYARQFLP